MMSATEEILVPYVNSVDANAASSSERGMAVYKHNATDHEVQIEVSLRTKKT